MSTFPTCYGMRSLLLVHLKEAFFKQRPVSHFYLHGSVRPDKPTDSEQFSSPDFQDVHGSLSSGEKAGARKKECCTLAHSVIILLQKAPVISQIQVGLKKSSHDCR